MSIEIKDKVKKVMKETSNVPLMSMATESYLGVMSFSLQHYTLQLVDLYALKDQGFSKC